MTRFIADSSCDILSIEGVDFQSVPLVISTDKHNFTDDNNLDIHNMLDILASHKGRSYTACPGIDAWLNSFNGADEIFVVTITSGMSGTYNSAMNAVQMYLDKNPETKIKVIDSKSTGPSMKLILEKLVELYKNGLDFEGICEAIDKYTESLHLFCSLMSLHNLAQNGRINKLVASAAEVLNISIVGTASNKGILEPIAKCRGEKKLLSKFKDLLSEAGYNGKRLRICHVENEALAEKLSKLVQQLYPEADIAYYEAGGLCSYYAERGGLIFSFEV